MLASCAASENALLAGDHETGDERRAHDAGIYASRMGEPKPWEGRKRQTEGLGSDVLEKSEHFLGEQCEGECPSPAVSRVQRQVPYMVLA